MQRPVDTGRLRFELWGSCNAKHAHDLWSDLEVTRFIGGPFDGDTIDAKIRREEDAWLSAGVQYWPIYLTSSGEFVGCCGLRPYACTESEEGATSGKVYEVGFHIKKDHWGKGLATEAAQHVIDFAFRVLGAAWLFAGHNPQNDSSKLLLTHKLGFEYTHDELYPPTGLMHPSYCLRRPVVL